MLSRTHLFWLSLLDTRPLEGLPQPCNDWLCEASLLCDESLPSSLRPPEHSDVETRTMTISTQRGCSNKEATGLQAARFSSPGRPIRSTLSPTAD
uniref:Putative secreted protein n=1 Tax=Anopheles darlingi TaxID=43151 RepID=A0A2M4D9W2_ANODA